MKKSTIPARKRIFQVYRFRRKNSFWEKFFNKKGKHDSGRTPEWLKQYVFDNWGQTHDVTPFNRKFNPKTDPDALKIDWNTPVYCNPPYSHYKPFLKKGYEVKIFDSLDINSGANLYNINEQI